MGYLFNIDGKLNVLQELVAFGALWCKIPTTDGSQRDKAHKETQSEALHRLAYWLLLRCRGALLNVTGKSS